MVIDTDAGPKAVTLQEVVDGRLVFEAEMGPPKDVRQERLYVAGERHEVVVLSVGIRSVLFLCSFLSGAGS